ncbi:hypothetical protein ACHAWX_004084, partial [Stephanocyclus meneghinianus]
LFGKTIVLTVCVNLAFVNRTDSSDQRVHVCNRIWHRNCIGRIVFSDQGIVDFDV